LIVVVVVVCLRLLIWFTFIWLFTLGCYVVRLRLMLFGCWLFGSLIWLLRFVVVVVIYVVVDLLLLVVVALLICCCCCC